jgi:pyrroline-5-carboxylate reductase
MEIGFVGAGQMAGAIIEGIIGSGLVAADQVCAHDPDPERLERLAQATGIVPFAGNQEVVAAAQTLVLAVKPQVMPEVMEQLAAQVVARRPLVVSIAAGVTLAHLDGWLGPNTPVARVMPNMNARVREGMAAVAGNSVASDSQVEGVLELVRAVGHAIVLPERLFPAFTAVAGSSPAWVFLFVEALAQSALAAGMPKRQAREVAVQAVLGSAATLRDADEHPWELIDKVASPGGTTVAGLQALQRHGFEAAVAAAVAATIEREGQLGEG